MRRLASIGLVLFATFLALIPLSTPKITFKPTPPTEASIRADMRREKLQRQYDLAENQADHVFHRVGCSTEFSEAVAHAAVNNHVPVRVLAGVVYVESTCRANVVSYRDAVGLTQVNPKIWHYTKTDLLNPYFNTELGARILSAYIRRHGLREGLHHYNGLGNPSNEYSEKVLRAAGYNT